MAPVETLKTLNEMRRDSGLTIAQVIERALAVDPRFPRSHVGLLEIEERGTRDYWKIHALATVYGVEPEAVARVAYPKKQSQH